MPPGSQVFQSTGTIFKQIEDIIRMTKFYEDRTINVVSRALTRKKSLPLGIIGTNHLTKEPFSNKSKVKNSIEINRLTKFHENRTINVASKLLTSKNKPCPLAAMYFNQTELGNLAQNARYYALLQALEERFANHNQTELYRLQLRDRRQKASETLEELGHDIRRLENLSYPFQQQI
ncbi:hypothetical protein DPMN_021948 [Dreissena polymorpha]|uniref:Uncharacterized protein n=1 Tax=Dreissena polymorpha TaxID=45954 RepID=A0A9D4NJG2_DREPO|nr:hypothetical protein DPMN_021948 [Dreissena polymorpha]